MKTIKILDTKKISNLASECIYDKLRCGDYRAEITIENLSGKHPVDVLFLNDDLCISSFGLNFYTRTPKAVKGERYKTLGLALRALKRHIKDNCTFKLVSNLRIYNESAYWGTHLFSLEL